MDEKTTPASYFYLFWLMFKLSLLTFGGGYVIISLLQKELVENKKLLTSREMMNMTAISQSAPGAVAINASLIVGYRLKGFKGALVSVVGAVLPPLLVITGISFFYTAFKTNVILRVALRGTQAAVAAILLDVAIALFHQLWQGKDYFNILIMCFSFALILLLKLNPVLVLLGCAVIALLRYEYKAYKNRDHNATT
ncbi:chromate transporter [Guggenheimella bovis]